MSDLSRFLKGAEKVVSDVWNSDAGRIIVPALIGYGVGGLAASGVGMSGTTATYAAAGGALAGASYGLSSVQQKKAIESAEALQRKQIAAQFELAGQRGALTEEQMRLQMGQRQIGMLTQLFLEQDREPRFVTLPASREPPGIVDRFNLWIDQALRA